MSQSRAVRFFTGAPEAKALCWNPGALIVPLLPCFTTEGSLASSAPFMRQPEPVWRSISLSQSLLPNEHHQYLEQPYCQNVGGDAGMDPDETSFLDTKDLSFVSCSISEEEFQTPVEVEDVLTQFFEQSFAAFEEIQSSQIVGLQSSNETSFITTASDFSDSYLDPNVQDVQAESRLTPIAGPVIDLKDIPNAVYLRSINPQTMTVNLVVGIISIPPPRTIKSKKGGRVLELVEMIVADESRAGFGINIWLPPVDSQNSNFRAIASSLRPQDVISIRNVALGTFRNDVYGQSLRRDMTKLNLMYRRVIDKHDERGFYDAQALDVASTTDSYKDKVKRVRDWVMQFVGAAGPNKSQRQTRMTYVGNEARGLPQDTQ